MSSEGQGALVRIANVDQTAAALAAAMPGAVVSLQLDPTALLPVLEAQTNLILDEIAGIVIPPVSLTQVNAKLDAILAVLVPVPPPVNVLPTVGLTSAVLVATEPGSALASVTASDSDGSIVKVELFKDGAFFAVRNQAPFTFSLTGLVAGTYQLTAKAYDNSDGIATSAVSLVTINPVVVDPPPLPQVTPIPTIP